jgi:small GTP-binding protein
MPITGNGSDREVRAALIGNISVGKTSLFERFQNQEFASTNTMTVGCACARITVQAEDGTDVRLLVWDTAGQEEYRAIIQLYFRSAAFVLVLYDISRKDSFESVNEWVSLARAKAPAAATYLLIGNKCDLEDERQIPMSEGEQLAQSIGAVFVETSAATGVGISEVLQAMADMTLKFKPAMLTTCEGEVDLAGDGVENRCC